jgi:hypothetical protein
MWDALESTAQALGISWGSRSPQPGPYPTMNGWPPMTDPGRSTSSGRMIGDHVVEGVIGDLFESFRSAGGRGGDPCGREDAVDETSDPASSASVEPWCGQAC